MNTNNRKNGDVDEYGKQFHRMCEMERNGDFRSVYGYGAIIEINSDGLVRRKPLKYGDIATTTYKMLGGKYGGKIEGIEWNYNPNKGRHHIESKKHKSGYKRIQLTYSRKAIPIYIHHMLAQSFLGLRATTSDLSVVIHKDGDKSHSVVSNLEVTTKRRAMLKNKTEDTGLTFKSGKWEASIKVNGKRKYIGRFSDKTEAKAAYDKIARIVDRSEYRNMIQYDLDHSLIKKIDKMNGDTALKDYWNSELKLHSV